MRRPFRGKSETVLALPEPRTAGYDGIYAEEIFSGADIIAPDIDALIAAAHSCRMD